MKHLHPIYILETPHETEHFVDDVPAGGAIVSAVVARGWRENADGEDDRRVKGMQKIRKVTADMDRLVDS